MSLPIREKIEELLVFSVTPFKIDQNKNQDRSEGKCAKPLVKIQVTASFLMPARYAEKFFTQICRDFYGDAMLVPIHLGAASRKSLEIQAQTITKLRTYSERKFV